MSSRHLADDVRQYGPRSSSEVRSTLLALTSDFVRAARGVPGVQRIAMIGSLLTAKPRPKDADVLVTLAAEANLGALAKVARRLKGSAQSKINSGADVFLANSGNIYLGRAYSDEVDQ